MSTSGLPQFHCCITERDGDWWNLRNRLTNELYIRREVRFLPRGLRSRPAIAGYLYALKQYEITPVDSE